MMDFDININENSEEIVTISTEKMIKYAYGKEKKQFLKEISKEKYYNVKIVNGNITFNINKVKIKINNYKANKNKYVEKIILQAQKIKIKETKLKLKNKKVNRTKKIINNVVALSLSAVSVFYAPNLLKKEMNFKSNLSEQNAYNQLVQENNIDKEEIKEQIFNINYYDRTDSLKFKQTKEKYYDVIKKVSKQYGISPQIMLAIATQERGVHSSVKDAYAIGLMQIELSVWNNQDITSFNFEQNNYETVHITEQKLGDLEFNIKVACMIFRQCFKSSNYNLPLAIQMYNYGQGNINKVLNYCEKDRNFSKEDILNDEDCNWTDYREFIKKNGKEIGDKEYLEHVASYIENKESLICKINNKTQIKYKIASKEKNNSLI